MSPIGAVVVAALSCFRKEIPVRPIKVLGLVSLLGLTVLGGANVVAADSYRTDSDQGEHHVIPGGSHQANVPSSASNCVGYVGICGQTNVFAPNIGLLNLLSNSIVIPTPTQTPPAGSDRNIKSDVVPVVWER
ncbi:hypothetical protein ACIBCM_23915 [Streptomyces sp. NPDC051018]|uniref:hypothetical protein n=1 Tax=Streptomyces sp. NPDC051018 TaxID=3365639 RepID=UPI0037B29EE4